MHAAAQPCARPIRWLSSFLTPACRPAASLARTATGAATGSRLVGSITSASDSITNVARRPAATVTVRVTSASSSPASARLIVVFSVGLCGTNTSAAANASVTPSPGVPNAPAASLSGAAHPV